MKEYNNVVLTASTMAALDYCQTMVTLGLGEGFKIEQIIFALHNSEEGKEHNTLAITAYMTVFKAEWPRSNKNPKFVASFSLIRCGGERWGMVATLPIVLDSRSRYGSEYDRGFAEFYARTPQEIVLTKPFDKNKS